MARFDYSSKSEGCSSSSNLAQTKHSQELYIFVSIPHTSRPCSKQWSQKRRGEAHELNTTSSATGPDSEEPHWGCSAPAQDSRISSIEPYSADPYSMLFRGTAHLGACAIGRESRWIRERVYLTRWGWAGSGIARAARAFNAKELVLDAFMPYFGPSSPHIASPKPNHEPSQAVTPSVPETRYSRCCSATYIGAKLLPDSPASPLSTPPASSKKEMYFTETRRISVRFTHVNGMSGVNKLSRRRNATEKTR